MTNSTPAADRLFADALQHPAGPERSAFLIEACGEHAALRERVERLLRAHDDALSFLEEPPTAIKRDAILAVDQPTERPGAHIGPYKLLEQIGEGGMGVVYLAEQTEPVRRRVALKIIKPGMDSRQVIARFEAERQALSLMDHPNIAKVLDAGATESGRPYFVMELVKGQPITQYCDEHHLTPRQRLELLLPVCQAIQHAHQKGIIHRDIKPTNILVAEYDQKAVPKVIDFGVAKAISQPLTEKTTFTGFGQIVGTLEYMSPEQAKVNQLDIDTRSDIYSLGVLLYELLTGSTPFDKQRLRSAAWDEMLRIIREEEPEKPSTRLSSHHAPRDVPPGLVSQNETTTLASIAAVRGTEPARLTKLVRGELDWIVMKALEKDRNRRYETASGFAADLQRYLADEAVLACPPSAAYRLRKFAWRNRSALATAGLLLFFIVLLGGVVGWAWRDRNAREHEIAQEAARKLALTEEGIRQALVRANASRAELLTILEKPGGVQELLNQSALWELFLETAQGELSQARQLAAGAEGSLDPEYTRSMSEFEQQVADDKSDYELAQRLENIRLDIAITKEGQFQVRKASDGYAKIFAAFEVPSDDPVKAVARIAHSPIKHQLVASLDNWARIASHLNDPGLVDQLLAVARQAAPDPAWGDRLRHPNVWRDREALEKLLESALVADLSPTTLSLVGLLLSKAKSARTEAWLRSAQAMNPSDYWLNFELGLMLLETSEVEAAGFFRAAIAVRPRGSRAYAHLGTTLIHQKMFDQAVASFDKAIELDPDFAAAYDVLGVALSEQKKLDESVAALRKAIELEPKFAEPYSNLGVVLLEQKRLDEAIAAHRQAVKLDPLKSNYFRNLGAALQAQGKVDEAIAAYRKAIELAPTSAMAFSSLGLALHRQQNLDEAIAALRKAIELDPKLSIAYLGLGTALDRPETLDEAVAAYRKAIELEPTSAMAFSNLGLALVRQKKLDDGIAACRKAIELEPKYADPYNVLGMALAGQTKWDEAAVAFRRAIELDPKLTDAHHNLATNLAQQGKFAEAIACCRKALEINPKDINALVTLGIALRNQGELDEAATAYREVIKLDPKDAIAHFNLGIALHQQGKLDEAIGCYREALKVNPTYVKARNNLVSALGEMGWQLVKDPDAKFRDPKRGVELAREAVELDPQSFMAWQYLGWIQYGAGNWKTSIEALAKSCELQDGGDCGQWIVMSLSHGRLAIDNDLPEPDRARHRAEARRRYDQSVKQIDGQGGGGDKVAQAIRVFRAEAAEMFEVKEKPK